MDKMTVNSKFKVGHVYGQWTVIDFPYRFPGCSSYFIPCRCSCGVEKDVASNNLGTYSKQCQKCSGRAICKTMRTINMEKAKSKKTKYEKRLMAYYSRFGHGHGSIDEFANELGITRLSSTKYITTIDHTKPAGPGNITVKDKALIRYKGTTYTIAQLATMNNLSRQRVQQLASKFNYDGEQMVQFSNIKILAE